MVFRCLLRSGKIVKAINSIEIAVVAMIMFLVCFLDLAFLLIMFKFMIIPLIIVGIMEEVNLKVDSKGRICIPAEIREQIGNTATLKKTSAGYLLLPGKQKDAIEELHKIITSKHPVLCLRRRLP
jgi:hypothetical protein